MGNGIENGQKCFNSQIYENLMIFSQVPDEIIRKKVLRSGDGNHKYSKQAKKSDFIDDKTERFGETFWGFGDKEMSEEDKKLIKVL